MNILNIAHNEFKVEDVILCSIDDERCNSVWDCSECDKARREIMSVSDMILSGVLPNKSRATENHPHKKGLVNENNTIILFDKKEDALDFMQAYKDSYNVVNDESVIKISDVYPEFELLRKYAILGNPSYYLFNNHTLPMIAVYVDCCYLTCPLIETEW